MTFDKSAWAIDHAETRAALARRATFASTSGAEGIIGTTDLKVSPLDVPGVGFQIAGGTALVLNRYQTTPSETYTVLNADVHTYAAEDMPAANSAAQSYLVAVTIGDPEFDQTGHPWMTSNDPVAGEEDTFQYVRPYLIPVANNVTSAAGLGLQYPALALARIDIPANTTTITAAMISDLRHLARPRSQEVVLTAASSAAHALNSTDWVAFPPEASWSVDIPSWATTAKVLGFVEGLQHSQAVVGAIRIGFSAGGAAQATNINESATTSGVDNVSYNLGGEIAVPAAYRGTTRTIRIEADNASGNGGRLSSSAFSSETVRILFQEQAS